MKIVEVVERLLEAGTVTVKDPLSFDLNRIHLLLNISY